MLPAPILTFEDDKAGHLPLYEAIVLKARKAHLAGATVLRGSIGFGRSSILHMTKMLRLSQDLPIVIEIVDAEERIESFLPELEKLMGSGLVTFEKVTILQYGDQLKAGSHAPVSRVTRRRISASVMGQLQTCATLIGGSNLDGAQTAPSLRQKGR